MEYEYLLIKRNGNRDRLIYDRRYFDNPVGARRDFRKGDILLKCKEESIFYDYSKDGWSVKDCDIIAKYEK